MSKADDIETLEAKLTQQRDAKERWGYRADTEHLNALIMMTGMLRRWDTKLWDKYGPEMSAGKGIVRKVADGDTLFSSAGQTVTRIRLYGIDAPEMKQPFGEPAKKFLSDLILWRSILFDPIKIDKYRRCVAIVWTVGDRVSVNARMVDAGFAWVEPVHCGREICGRWRKMEAGARQAGRGLWSQDAPDPPWVARQNHEDD